MFAVAAEDYSHTHVSDKQCAAHDARQCFSAEMNAPDWLNKPKALVTSLTPRGACYPHLALAVVGGYLSTATR